MLSQWIAIVLVMLVLFGLAFVFVRKGLKVRPDPENKPQSDLGGFG